MELTGYLHKKTKHDNWQKRWFETNGFFLTYYKREGEKLLAALNLPQLGPITLLPENHSDGPGQFTLELNERLYTVKADTHEEAREWVELLKTRQAGHTSHDSIVSEPTAVDEMPYFPDLNTTSIEKGVFKDSRQKDSEVMPYGCCDDATALCQYASCVVQ